MTKGNDDGVPMEYYMQQDDSSAPQSPYFPNLHQEQQSQININQTFQPQQQQQQQIQHNPQQLQQQQDLYDSQYLFLKPSPDAQDYEDLAIKDKFLENMFGANVRSKKAKVPEGFVVSYTKSGQPFLISVAYAHQDNEDYLAANEHSKQALPIACSNAEVERVYGTGIYLYFNFITFCIIVNVILLVFVLINLVPHFYYGSRKDDFSGFTIQDYILIAPNLQSYYQSEAKLYYFWSTFACVLLSFAVGPIYALKVNKYFQKNNKVDFEDGFDSDDIILKNVNLSGKKRIIRRVISYSIFIILLCISTVLCALVLKLINSYKENNFLSLSLVTSFISAAIIRIINVIYDQISIYLTRFERHSTWTLFKIHNTLKLFVFKVVNVIILYILRDQIFEKITHIAILEGCPLVDAGSQFLLILVLDLTLSNLWEIIYSLIFAAIGKRREQSGKRSSDYYKPEFDLSEEYLEILYRQFIVYLGIPIYPIVAVFGVACNIVEYYVDRFRLFRICKKPHRMQGSMKKFLSFYLLIISIVSVVTYPYGSGWVLIQIGFKHGSLYNKCSYLFENVIPTLNSSSTL
ncbi:hypothetical protein DICPUDRAFT_158970 [Dictyostelium purpureum]|uniref:Anoctamin transmembrane domain-containing protein n=1 Tax=Dictyostelium purpureum TaxID=5786 RepID=F1A2Y2_DICPU|nr:uncharacterized protein DICPUDRAFT_158970 [Dictyostelium purpureum]EGC29449.1 hypothetical protein DICPUDRAFT_158970 [Dictyostelium purpureum]|eukprot:XP_003294027.1 hypothetical protein DICPUDRAFT_158970 [Dictyostelium purpureum]